MKTQRIILDENFSDGLAIALRKLGHDVVSVHETEWVGFKNGALGAELARSDFDVIITKDRINVFKVFGPWALIKGIASPSTS